MTLQSFQYDTSAVDPSTTAFSTLGAGAYDALDARGRRRPGKTRTLHEDRHLNQKRRRALTATARDAVRNHSVVAWMVRRHLDFVTTFNFQSRTNDEGWNRECEAFVAEVGRARRFDLARRHNRARAMRITEARAVVDGDHGWLKYRRGRNRGRVQMIEGDLIAVPSSDVPAELARNRQDWVNGVQVDRNTGEARRYALCTRNRAGSGLKFSRAVPSRSMIMRGYYERPDQVRGVSPLSSALNSLRDLYEGFDYALALIKTSQLFGLKIMRSATGGIEYSGDDYEVDPNKGVFMLDLEPGDDAEFLESKTPATETTNFLKLVTQVALKAIDLPYSFFDEAHTNFYGSRGGLLQYLIACQAKRDDNAELLDGYTRWRLGLAIADGELRLPSGRDFDWLRWLWVPRGVPWWDPAKEIRGQLMAIRAGLTSPQRVCRETGTNFEDNLAELAEALKLAQAKGVDLYFGDSGGVDLGLLEDAADRERQAQQDDEENDAD